MRQQALNATRLCEIIPAKIHKKISIKLVFIEDQIKEIVREMVRIEQLL